MVPFSVVVLVPVLCGVRRLKVLGVVTLRGLRESCNSDMLSRRIVKPATSVLLNVPRVFGEQLVVKVRRKSVKKKGSR